MRVKVLRKVLMVPVLAVALLLGLAAAPNSAPLPTSLKPEQADAAGSVYVYVSLPTWLGNCPNGGSVRYLQVSTWSLSATDYKADAGDDLVYIRAGYRENTTVVSQPLCYNGSRTYWGPASSRVIYATRNGQTWWLGPWGQRNN
jgi:hypothetical protein